MNSPTNPKIVVIGAGAVGSLLGGLLARAGSDVTLIGRPEHVAAINKTGLHIDGIVGEFIVPLHAETTLKFRPDLAILTVKMQDMETTCRNIAPSVRDVPILTLQNGVGSDGIAAQVFGESNIIGGIVLFNARYLNPGRVTYGIKGALLIGNVFRANEERVRDIGDLLNHVIPTIICDNITEARWTKLLMNLFGNSLDAMTGVSLGTCMKARGTSRIAALILKEALRVIEKANIRLVSLPHLSITALRLVIKSPLPISSRALQSIRKATDTVSSTLQSLQRGKPTEIDYLNGEIVRLGEKMNIPTPYNSKVVELIHEVEKTRQFVPPSRLESIFSNKTRCL